jgi:hypothetical protein
MPSVSGALGVKPRKKSLARIVCICGIATHPSGRQHSQHVLHGLRHFSRNCLRISAPKCLNDEAEVAGFIVVARIPPQQQASRNPSKAPREHHRATTRGSDSGG